MSNRVSSDYATRADSHPNALVKKLFRIAAEKKTNLVISADLTMTKDLLEIADSLGPFIAVFKTHIDIIEDFSPSTTTQLKALAERHNFLIFEDRKFVDIGSTVQKQYHGGALRISEWAHIVNLTMLPGPGIVQALSQTMESERLKHKGERGLLILAEMTSKGSLATGEYTKQSVEAARQFPHAVIGFVANKSLAHVQTETSPASNEDFVLFTTGVNRAAKGDSLGQQYQTPSSAIQGGADFVIAGRGIYQSEDPVKTVKEYREEAWNAYLSRIGQS